MENMDKGDIIRQLVKVEEAAESITLQMEEDKKRLREMIAEKEKQIKAEMEEKTKRDVEALKDRIYDESHDKLSKISIATQEMYASLEREYADNSQKWQEEIFNQIIGR